MCPRVGVGAGFAQHLCELAPGVDRPRSGSLTLIHAGSHNRRPVLSPGEGMGMGLVLSHHEEGAQKMTAGDSLIGIGGNYVA